MLQITKGLINTIYKVQLRTLAGAIATPILTIPESLVQPGFYSIDIPTVPPLSAGKYLAFYYRTISADTEFLGAERVQWDGAKVVVELASTQDLAVIKDNAIAARTMALNDIDTDFVANTITVKRDGNLPPYVFDVTPNVVGAASRKLRT